MYRLIFLTGKSKGRRLAVQQGTLVIGRDPECDLDLAEDDEVSRRHAIIEEKAGGVEIQDLGAMNTVEVNGKPIAKTAVLKHGDKIEIGRTTLLFQTIEAVAVTSRRSTGNLQMLTFGAVGLILLVQAGILLFSIFKNEELQTVAPLDPVGGATGTVAAAEDGLAGVSPEVATLEKELEHAVAVMKESERKMQEEGSLPVVVPASGDVSNQVDELRVVVEDLRQQVSEMNASLASVTSMPVVTREVSKENVIAQMPLPMQPAVTTPSVQDAEPPGTPRVRSTPEAGKPETAADEAVSAASAQKPAEDPLLAKAKDMMNQVKLEEQRSNLVKADEILERIQIMAPDFLPAYVERARLYEARGLLKKAGEQWASIMGRSMGSPLYEQAAAERTRLARAEITQSMTRAAADKESVAGGSDRLPRKIRVMTIDREKFSATKDYDEMRIVRVTMKSKLSEGGIDTTEIAVVVTFYDRTVVGTKIFPSRAVVPEEALRVEGEWAAGGQRSVTAAYIVPKNFRETESKEHGERSVYEGCRVQVYYKDQLQDDDAFPKSLLSLESPPPPFEDLRVNEAVPL